MYTVILCKSSNDLIMFKSRTFYFIYLALKHLTYFICTFFSMGSYVSVDTVIYLFNYFIFVLRVVGYVLSFTIGSFYFVDILFGYVELSIKVFALIFVTCYSSYIQNCYCIYTHAFYNNNI